MKSLINTIELILLLLTIIGLVFLFNGDPDLFDLLHVKAMEWAGRP